MPQTKNCRLCQSKFEVADDDLVFYKKISPTFAGKIYEIPPPTLCPECRQQSRIVFRNFWNLYKRKCDLTKKEIVSMYSPEPASGFYTEPITVYESDAWWSDKWNPTNYGRDYDPAQSFFNQIGDLMKAVPRFAVMNARSENCNYSNLVFGSRNCYLVFGCVNDEDCYYGHIVWDSKNCVDCLYVLKSELCYACVDCLECYDLQHCQDCKNCSNSKYLIDCIGCKDCFGCVGLRNKQYCVFNEQLSKEEYPVRIDELLSDESSVMAKLDKLKKNHIVSFMHGVSNKEVSGDYINYCKNVRNSFDAERDEDSKYLFAVNGFKDSQDVSFSAGIQSELIYNSLTSVGYKILFSHLCHNECRDIYYCDSCFACKNCFGCVGLKSQEYCILNKKYPPGEYDKKVAEIIEKMTGRGEWGEPFPFKLSPFGYNETMASLYYPIDRDEARRAGANWKDKEDTTQFYGEPLRIDKNIDFYIQNDKEVRKVLAGFVKCEVSGKPFKIMPQEMAFCLRQKISLPTKHYDVRRKELFALRNPRVLHHRQCMCEEGDHGHERRCPVEFETTYAPDRPEKVYCESCYQKSVI